jgi:hypothetical protein
MLSYQKKNKEVSICLQCHSNSQTNYHLKLVQIHFGVNSGATRFALENQAVNEATFRCPDELGWKPQVVILSNYLSLSIYLDIVFTGLIVPCRGFLLYHRMEPSHGQERYKLKKVCLEINGCLLKVQLRTAELHIIFS